MAKEVWAEDAAEDAKAKHQSEMVFPIGAPNDGFAPYFSGKSYLAPLSTAQAGIYNVTFEPGCRNNWHIHHAAKGGGQILVCVAGRGYYQEWGKAPLELHPGDVVNIPRRSSTGMVLHPIAGSLIWPWKCPVKAPLTSGASRWRRKPMGYCGNIYEMR